MLKNMCMPALIYFIYSFTQVILDSGQGLYNLAIMKLIIAVLFTSMLNLLCQRGLSIVSWIIIFIPFILMSIIVSIILIFLGLDPITGIKQ
jgi:hypothetical protein